MSEEPPPISILDARLAEIDRRLATIQTHLVAEGPEAESEQGDGTRAAAPPGSTPVTRLPPRVMVPGSAPLTGAGPAPPPPETQGPSQPARPEAAALIAQLRGLADAHARLLDSMRELISAHELAIAAPAAVRELSLSVGPLKSTEALREFEHALSRIPKVRGVEVRGYEGGDRAIVDVHLLDATS